MTTSNDIQINLKNFFDESWGPMVSLMERARQSEFKIRLTAEILSQTEFSNSQTFDEFKEKPRESQRKKMEKHIREVFGSDHGRFKVIRQCADSLAHADYLAARMRIEQYKKQYGLTATLNNDKKGLFFYENITHSDGQVAGMGYLLETSKTNLILEEYAVFEYNGYATAAAEILNYVEIALKNLVPNLSGTYATLVLNRGLKYGVREDT
jgi:hypothetical protein